MRIKYYYQDRFGTAEAVDGGALENQKGHCKYCGRDVSKNSRLCSVCRAKLELVRKIIAIGKLIKEAANDRE